MNRAPAADGVGMGRSFEPGDAATGCFAALRSDGCFEVLVRRAVVPLGQRRALARLALASCRAAARDAAVERARLDLLFDESHCRRDALAHCPGDLRLRGDGEVAANVLEKRPVRLGEVERVPGQPLDCVLARLEHLAAEANPGARIDVGVDEVLDRAIDRPRVLIHTALEQDRPVVEGLHLRVGQNCRSFHRLACLPVRWLPPSAVSLTISERVTKSGPKLSQQATPLRCQSATSRG